MLSHTDDMFKYGNLILMTCFNKIFSYKNVYDIFYAYILAIAFMGDLVYLYLKK